MKPDLFVKRVYNQAGLDSKRNPHDHLGIEKLLADTQAQLHALSDDDDDDDYACLANDATLIDTMIAGFEEEYRQKFN
jgi:hypothetical protein